MKTHHWNIEVKDQVQVKKGKGFTIVQSGYFDGSFAQCRRYIDEHFRNKANPITTSGSCRYYDPERYIILVTTSL